MVSLNLMVWNIQNFGKTKSKFDDCLEAIAKVIIDRSIDIFILVELNTTKQADARTFIKKIMDVLYRRSGDQHYKLSVLSPNTGLEFHGFIIRDESMVKPIPITGVKGDNWVPQQIGWSTDKDARTATLEDARFSVKGSGAGTVVLEELFPLLAPDDPNTFGAGRKRKAPIWIGTRKPCFGLFEIAGASAANTYMAILPGHYIPKAHSAKGQIDQFKNLTVIKAISDKSPKEVSVDGTLRKVNQVFLTGDFNIDYSDEIGKEGRISYRILEIDMLYKAALDPENHPKYDPIDGPPNTHRKTHLIPLSEFDDTKQLTTFDLIVKGYDNFFYKRYPEYTGQVSNFKVVDLARLIKDRDLSLTDMVNIYATKGQRGMTQRLQKQLTDITLTIDIEGALAGARLLSDHLPVMLTVDV